MNEQDANVAAQAAQAQLMNTTSGCLHSIALVVAILLFGPFFVCIGMNIMFSSTYHDTKAEIEARGEASRAAVE